MYSRLAWIALAGAVGTLCRYWVSGLVQAAGGDRFPWGTLAVNVAGCFLFGLISGLAEDRLLISNQTRFILATGFLGAFTTFSTFAYETTAYLRDSQWLLASANLVGQNTLGLAAVVVGFAASRMF